MKNYHVSIQYATAKGNVGSKNTTISADTAFEAIEKAETPLRKRGCSKFDGSAYELES